MTYPYESGHPGDEDALPVAAGWPEQQFQAAPLPYDVYAQDLLPPAQQYGSPIVFRNSFHTEQQAGPVYDHRLSVPQLDYNRTGSRNASLGSIASPFTPPDFGNDPRRGSGYFSFQSSDALNQTVQQYRQARQYEGNSFSTRPSFPASALYQSLPYDSTEQIDWHHKSDSTPTYGYTSTSIRQSLVPLPEAYSEQVYQQGYNHPAENRLFEAFRDTQQADSPQVEVQQSPFFGHGNFELYDAFSPLPYPSPIPDFAPTNSSTSTHHQMEQYPPFSPAQVQLSQLAISEEHPVSQSVSRRRSSTAAPRHSTRAEYGLDRVPAGMGNRACIIVAPKVGQRSYGTEKRWVTPPPSISLIGQDWWKNGTEELQIVAHMSGGDNVSQDLNVTSFAVDPNGQVCTPSLTAPASAARAMANRLMITDLEEDRSSTPVFDIVYKDLVSGARNIRLTGKTSRILAKAKQKKRGVKMSEESQICHGSIVSLFNRIRTQVVSVHYLCTSGNTAYPVYDCHKIGLFQVPHQGSTDAQFEVQKEQYDPYIIYLVDPFSNTRSALPSDPSFPEPPPGILPIQPGIQAIYANQTVILQCLHTGVASPIMIVRAAEKTVAYGNYADLSNASGATSCIAPGEKLGDEIGHLQQIAFEVMLNPITAYGGSGIRNAQGFEGSGTFLARADSTVGLFAVETSRMSSAPASAAPPTHSPMATPAGLHSVIPGDPQANFFSFPATATGSSGGSGSSVPTSRFDPSNSLLFGRERSASLSLTNLDPSSSNHGGKVPKKQQHRRASSINLTKSVSSIGGSPHKAVRKRGASVSGALGGGKTDVSQWSIEVGDKAVWFITSLDVKRYHWCEAKEEAQSSLTAYNPVIEGIASSSALQQYQ